MNLLERLTLEAKVRLDQVKENSPSNHELVISNLIKYTTYVDMPYGLVCDLYHCKMIKSMDLPDVSEIFMEIKLPEA